MVITEREIAKTEDHACMRKRGKREERKRSGGRGKKLMLREMSLLRFIFANSRPTGQMPSHGGTFDVHGTNGLLLLKFKDNS